MDGFLKAIHVDHPTPYATLVPYNLDLKSNGLDILYRSTKNQRTLSLIDKDVSKTLNGSKFESTEAVVITFNFIAKYDKPHVQFAYQVAIVTDYINTYVVISYKRLDENSATVIAFSDPFACKYYNEFFKNTDRKFLLATSNVGEAGKHVFPLTGPLKCKNVGGIKIISKFFFFDSLP